MNLQTYEYFTQTSPTGSYFTSHRSLKQHDPAKTIPCVIKCEDVSRLNSCLWLDITDRSSYIWIKGWFRNIWLCYLPENNVWGMYECWNMFSYTYLSSRNPYNVVMETQFHSPPEQRYILHLSEANIRISVAWVRQISGYVWGFQSFYYTFPHSCSLWRVSQRGTFVLKTENVRFLHKCNVCFQMEQPGLGISKRPALPSSYSHLTSDVEWTCE